MKLGTYLKNKREKSGITLREMESGSGIKKSVILIIEAGDLSKLPEPKHTKHLIRKYADYVKLDADMLFERFSDELPKATTDQQKRNQKEDQDFKYLKKILIGFITMILVLFVVWLVLLQIGSEGDLFETKRVYETDSEVIDDIASSNEEKSTEVPEEEAESEETEGETAEEETEETSEEEAEEAPTTDVSFVNREGNTLIYNITTSDTFSVEISGDEPSWVSLTDDLENSYLYEESEGGTFDIDPEASVLNLALGNSTNFDVSIDGQPLDNSLRGDTVTIYYQFNITRE